MAHQLIFTSMRRTLIGGSGYGIAAQTPNFPKVLAEELARHSGYTEIYPASGPNRAFNPINYLHQKAGNWHILGRISHADNDYSGRSNYLAQYFVLEPSELSACGPVALLQHLPFLEKFEGDSRILAPSQLPQLPASKPKPCAAWRKVVGDAGWSGELADRLTTSQPVALLYGKNLHGSNAMDLVGETLALLAPADQWKITFCTHLEGYPKASSCRLKMLQEGCPTARDFRQRPECWDLTKGSLGPVPEGAWADFARTGIVSTVETGKANIAELDPNDLDKAIESYQPPILVQKESPGILPPPVVRVLPDEPKPDSRLKKQAKVTRYQSKGSPVPYLFAGAFSLLTLAIGFLAGYLPQNGAISALNSELEKLEKEKAETQKDADGKQGQLVEFKKQLEKKEADLLKEKETAKSNNDRTKESDKTSAALQKKHDEIQDQLFALAEEFKITQDELALLKAQKDPLSDLRNQNIFDQRFGDIIDKLPEKVRNDFLNRIKTNKKNRDVEIDTSRIIREATDKYQLKADLVFRPDPKKPSQSLAFHAIPLPTINNVIQKGIGGKPIPAVHDLKELFKGAYIEDSNKSIFWVAQGPGKVPFALNVAAINILLDNRDVIENVYRATLDSQATTEVDRDLLTKGWKDYSATLDAFLDLKKQAVKEIPSIIPNPLGKEPVPIKKEEKKGENPKNS
jgi:hypothetical protein